MRAKFRHMCFYGPYGNQQGALCNFPSNSHQWQSLYQHARNDGQYKNRFLCAARAKDAKYKGGGRGIKYNKIHALRTKIRV